MQAIESSPSHKLKQHKDVENKWNIPFVTEDCGVNESDGREAESIVNLLMLRYLSIYQSIYFSLWHLADVCTWELVAGSTSHFSYGMCLRWWNKGAGMQLHLPHYYSSQSDF